MHTHSVHVFINFRDEFYSSVLWSRTSAQNIPDNMAGTDHSRLSVPVGYMGHCHMDVCSMADVPEENIYHSLMLRSLLTFDIIIIPCQNFSTRKK